MGSPLIPLALAGAAVVLISSGKKKKKGGKGGAFSYNAPYNPPPNSFGGGEIPQGDSSSQSSWVERQKALHWVSLITFSTKDGGSVQLCKKCNPGAADGKPGKNTRNAIKAFQAIAGLGVDGEWGHEEDVAMDRIVAAVESGEPISCDPLLDYPAPFACFVRDGGGFGLMLTEGANGDSPSETPSSGGGAKPSKPPADAEYGPNDLLVADAECNYILHQDDRWFDEQKSRAIGYALEGMTDGIAAEEINESMLADYIPICLSLGRDGVGPGVRQFWDVNTGWIFSLLQKYELLPELLEEDAIKFGLL